MSDLKQLAITLDEAAKNAEATAQIAETHGFGLDEAYEIQRLSIAQRIQRNEKLVGLKMGFTSVAKMEQMGVHDLIWGRLTSDMLIGDNGSIELSRFIHPRAEPEIAFKISENIDKEVPMEEIRSICNGVSASIEIIDSRFENFTFSLEDVVADNCSSSGFVHGEWHDVDTPIGNIDMSLIINGVERKQGSSSAILGDPWKSLQAATRLAEKFKEPIKEDFVILAGAATAAEFLKAGDKVVANVASLGNISFKVE